MKTKNLEKRLAGLLGQALGDLKKDTSSISVRLNIMVPRDGFLSIIAHTSGYSQEELTIKLAGNQGCAGESWQNGVEVVGDRTKKHDSDWDIPPEEAQKVNKNLKSIISVPIYDPDYYDSFLGIGPIIGILNADSESIYAGELLDITQIVLRRYALRIAEILEEYSNA